ncbi:GBSi1, group II intron, maturase [Streptococcus pseudopneumoniae IS7493]|nr:GBSi1, group II intron, maturase [Streptococcus pseudopneumoniae IS7493]
MKSIQLNMNKTKKYLVIKAIDQGKKTKNRACVELNLSERQINRLLLAYQQKGKEAFRHGNRNRKPKHAIPDESKIIALNLTIFCHKTLVGTPQGGNVSPLLSNIMLNELDKELEKRGLRFVRYADDCVMTVGSEAAAKRVMYSVSRFIEKRLGLKVNMTKTKITRPRELKYLGFGFWKSSSGWKSRPHQDSVRRFKFKLKKLTQRKWSIDLTRRIEQLNLSIRGWINYFSLGNMKSIVTSIDERLRTRLRVIIWKQWKKKSRRLWGLLKLGVPKWIADKVSGWGDHYQLVAQKSVLKRAISKPVLEKRGLVSCLDYYLERHALKVS